MIPFALFLLIVMAVTTIIQLQNYREQQQILDNRSNGSVTVMLKKHNRRCEDSCIIQF